MKNDMLETAYVSSMSERSDFLIWLVALSMMTTVRRAILKCNASISLFRIAADDAVRQSDWGTVEGCENYETLPSEVRKYLLQIKKLHGIWYIVVGMVNYDIPRGEKATFDASEIFFRMLNFIFSAHLASYIQISMISKCNQINDVSSRLRCI